MIPTFSTGKDTLKSVVPLDANVVDKALVQGNAFLELIDFNPLVYGVGLGDITGAQYDHLLHFFAVSHAIGTVGHGEGAPFSR